MIVLLTCRDRLTIIKQNFEKDKSVSTLYACRVLSDAMLALIEDFPERESDINKEFCAMVCGAL